MAGLFHDFDDAVKRNRMAPIGKLRVQICIKSTRCSIGIALNTWNLDKSTHRVACQSQMVLKSHFGRIFNLGRSATK